MFKPHLNICYICGKRRLIVVKALMCKECRANYNKTKKTQRNKRLIILTGKEKLRVFSSIKKKFRKPTGELSVFESIWEKRPHKSELSGLPINQFQVSCFAHILSKGSHPKFRLKEENILMITPTEHLQQHSGTLPEAYKIIFAEKAQQLKQLYYGVQKESSHLV